MVVHYVRLLSLLLTAGLQVSNGSMARCGAVTSQAYRFRTYDYECDVVVSPFQSAAPDALDQSN